MVNHGIPRVELGSTGFVLVWLFILGLHAICAAYMIAAAQVYAALPYTSAGRVLELYKLTLGWAQYPRLVVVHYVFAAMHIYALLKSAAVIIFSSVIPKRANGRIQVAHNSITQQSGSPARSPTQRVIALARVSLSDSTRRLRSLLAYTSAVFSVQSEQFELSFVLREVLETSLSSYQAYTMSRFLTRQRLNQFFTILLIVNCWTTPVVKRICHRNEPLERLVVVLIDILLDFVSSIGVPVILVLQYFAMYDPSTADFMSGTFWWDDVPLLNFMNEAPLIFFGSWIDAISRLILSLTLLWSLDDVKLLVSRRRRAQPRIVLMARRVGLAKILPRGPSLRLLQRESKRLARLVSKWGHRVLVLWGFVIFVAYIESHFRASPSFCALELRPWFVRRPACAVVVINCRTSPFITGTETDFAFVFRNLDIGSVEHVMYRHCPRIQIPSQFQNLRNLFGIKVYNSTIERWELDAAFTRHTHSRARIAFFVRVEFPTATPPPGMLHPHFPTTLTDIEFVVTNVRELPLSLPWPSKASIQIEFSQLEEFPAVLLGSKSSLISLAFNRITEIPAELIMTPDLAIIMLRGNPIHSLPDTGVNISMLHNTGTGIDLYLVAIEHTMISKLPAWITEEFVERIQLLAAGSPICTEVLQNVSSRETELMLATRPWLAAVQAMCDFDPGIVGVFPLALDDTRD